MISSLYENCMHSYDNSMKQYEMNSYDLECMELLFFLIFLFFERGTVIDIILQILDF